MVPGASGRARFPSPKAVDYNPEPLREVVRASVTGLTIAIFFYVVWFYLNRASTASEVNWPRVGEAMHTVLPAVTSVLGTALGFYFGSQKR